MIRDAYYSVMEFLSFFSLIYILLYCGSALGSPIISKNITVDQNGGGDFKYIKEALDSVPMGNKEWIRIHVKQGIYKEKIWIPKEKPFILLEGDNVRTTKIQWNDSANSLKYTSQNDLVQVNGRLTNLGTLGSATFTVMAQNFVARNITFENTFAPSPDNPPSQAVALTVGGDKSAFYRCAFIGVQDTLSDYTGRHFFDHCYIQGFTDFVFGFGQSIYNGCSLKVLGRKGKGFVTAQGRKSEEDPSGFVFMFSSVSVEGSAVAFLGRAWTEHSRVIFYKTHLSGNIEPQGWYAWNTKSQGALTTYAEEDCDGDGAVTSKRVSWEKQLSVDEVAVFTNGYSFIDEEGWLAKQP